MDPYIYDVYLVSGDPIAATVLVRFDNPEDPSKIQLVVYGLVTSNPDPDRRGDTVASFSGFGIYGRGCTFDMARHECQKTLTEFLRENLERSQTDIVSLFLEKGWRRVPGSIEKFPHTTYFTRPLVF